MFEYKDGTSEIEVKLTTSGRYTWKIASTFPTEEAETAIKNIRKFNKLLQEEFPDYARRGSGRVSAIDEE